ncbi:MAG: lysophospholipid acyltransferase family protein [Prolixibacteraceae bacterium]|nr:lysophospholipid acyltransferase family protein [Prolixibacteraceae bacterium]
MNIRIITKIGILFLNVLSRFPFRLIYLISDILYFFVNYIFCYRKKVILNNLKKAFPNKTEKERRQIQNSFYHHFCDLTLESIKLQGMSDKDFDERLMVKNNDLLNRYYNKGESVIVLTMHYNNWEWCTRLSKYLKHKTFAVYKPLHNKEFDKYLTKTRTTEGTKLIKNSQILRQIIKAKKNNEPVIIWLAGDQTPPYFHKSWYLFLNQEALFYIGPATLSKQFNLPVIFQWIEKTGRGKYTSVFEPIIENPSAMSESEIIKTYIRRMEEIIHRKPEFYLWSHKRWKHKKPENMQLQ